MANRSDSRRAPQLAYSQIQDLTYDENRRRRKAAKIVAVLKHYLGRETLDGLVVVDIGCSTGFTADELRRSGGMVIGMDIDVPGLAHAQGRFGADVHFLCGDGSKLPFAEASVDVIVFNHIYEHVVDPDAILEEIRRVLRPDGVAYFGFGNKFGVIEPHYRLPFLSWLPRTLAHRYVAAWGRSDEYYERYRGRRGLKRMCAPLKLWDYTYTILADSEHFMATDMVPRRLSRLPAWTYRMGSPVMPTFVWVGTPGDSQPHGPITRNPPTRL